MCQLFAMSFEDHIRPNISFRGFLHEGNENPQGWGISFYPDTSVQVIKEPLEAERSDLSGFVENYDKIKSDIFIGHVRTAKTGEVSHRNTHPFHRELNGREYSFAHNGTLKDFKKLKLDNFHPVGETDSEHVFCHIMDHVRERNIADWKEDDFGWLYEKLQEINKLGSFNVIMSDDDHLFCYFDKNSHIGLKFVYREPTEKEICLKDEHWNIVCEEGVKDKGYMVASVALTDEDWEFFEEGELIVFKNGKMIYSSSGRDLDG